ncbi:lipopolysaccharide biosynthesis protein [Leucothrix pacifica]|uniref:Polysaccharide biosynthesis protein C-terminal domain-containing protein n=1 Tax=Leucothrix pacifica TaxID=1247513 RepID=A0A317CBQ2_9GAMM|nr:hypothetical protein [Leucothrix pacifica]PWQ95799.1 hypothetical protein DKW60_13940 [Leucothrix pacifica]
MFFKKFSLGMVNQAITSITSFLLVLFYMVLMSKSEFGLYSILYSVTLLISSSISALITTQVVIFISGKNERKHEVVFEAIILILLLIVILFLLLIPFAYLFDVYRIELSLVAVASLFLSIKEVLTRYSFLEERIIICVEGSILSALIVLIALFFFKVKNLSVCATTGLLLFCLVQVISTFYMLLRIRLTLQLGIVSTYKLFLKLLINGKWALVNNFFYIIRSQGHVLLASFFLVTEDIAKISASRVFITPFVMMMPVLSNVLLPYYTKLRSENGKDKVKKLSLVALKVQILAYILYSLFLLVSVQYILDMNYFEKYKDLSFFVTIWLIYLLFLVVRNNMELIISSFGKFKEQFQCSISSFFLSIPFVLMFFSYLGGVGAIMSSIVFEIFLIYFYRSKQK